MVYNIIFYHSGKTAEAERLTDKKLSALTLSKGAVYAAVSPSELAKRLKNSLSAADIAIIIGGLDGGRQSTDTILSLVLSSKASSMQCEKLLDDDDNIAYLIKAGRQYILVLPDDPDAIAAMLDKRMEVRPLHLEGMERLKEHLIAAGGMLDDEGKLKGSVLIMEFQNREELDEYLTNEIYVTEHVWEKITVERMNVVYAHGERVGQ